MLKVENLNIFYGNIHAVHDVSLHVNEGEIVSLIGANGAGKTTILQTISGLKKAASGTVILKDQDLLKTECFKILPLGLAHVPEGRRIFSKMTVEENLELGAFLQKDKAKIHEGIERSYNKFPRLRERRKQLAGTLSGGEQQMLAIARALMGDPSLLLLDEPSMGLSPILVSEIFNIIEEINKNGVTVLLVEQNANKALELSDRTYVLESGRIVMEGNSKELKDDPKIKKAYLGA
ncbi:MAG: ABC transporter ATP-binding protein [Clostridiaceae bacterium]